MVKVEIRYLEKKEFLDVPLNIQQLNNKTKELFNIKQPTYKYYDYEDNEIISVDVQIELDEALRYILLKGSHLIVEDKTPIGDLFQFIEELPLLKSQITTDDGMNIDPGPVENQQEKSEVLEKFGESPKESSNVVSEERFEFDDIELCNDLASEVQQKSGSWKEEEKVDVLEELKFEVPLKVIEVPKEILKEKEVGAVNEAFFAEKDKFGGIKIQKEEVEEKIEESVVDVKMLPEITLIEEDLIDLNGFRDIIRDELKKSQIDLSVVHLVSCSGCRVQPIRGVLYKCNICYGFYLCSQCEEEEGHKHCLLKLKKPQPINKLEEMRIRICNQLKFTDNEKVIDAIIKNNYDYNKVVAFLLGKSFQ